MKKKNLARLMSGILSAAMVITTVPASTEVQAQEAGITAIGKLKELVIDRYTSGGVESKIYSGDGAESLSDAAVTKYVSLTGTGTAHGEASYIAPGSAYSVATAFDPDGNGVADWIARVSLEDKDEGGRILLSVSKAKSNDYPYVAFLNNDTGGYIATTDSIEASAVEGLINVTAGDFDGDGMDELAVYAPNNSDAVETQDEEGNYSKNQLSVKIYDMDFDLSWSSFDIKEEIPEPTKVIEIGEGTTRWNSSLYNDNKQYYNIPYLAMMAEDVDGDGVADLTTVANFSRWNMSCTDDWSEWPMYMGPYLLEPDLRLASVMDIYTGSKNSDGLLTQTVKKKVLMGYDSSYYDGAGTMFAVRNANVALGSVTDANSREIIIAGNCYRSVSADPTDEDAYFCSNS